MDIDAIDAMLNKESGLKGLCGMNDMRDIHEAIARGDKRAELALTFRPIAIKNMSEPIWRFSVGWMP